MSRQRTAATLLSPGQAILAIVLVILAATQTVVFGPLSLLRTIVALITAFYVVFVGFKFLVWSAATPTSASRIYERLAMLSDATLPMYTVLVPIVKEANGVAPLVQSLSELIYPISKLQILLLLEEYDTETQDAVNQVNLPSQFKVLIVPDVGPRTKPKACNYGYMHAKGKCVVIYDAEDRPHKNQLRFAATVFQYMASKAKTKMVGCLQARLAFWNPRVSNVATFYWAEYVVHFYTMLEGMARLGFIAPLGGTSNHFRKDALDDVAMANGEWVFDAPDGRKIVMYGPWDPYNLTEDADLAFRLEMAGWHIKMIPTVTYEEAPSGLIKAKDQRSRWLQGYAQTGLVHTRQPISSIRRVGLLRWLGFNLYILGTPFSILINPLTWATTILYIVSRLWNLTSVTLFLEGLFPGPVYYAGMLVAVVGNALLFYQKLITPLKRQQQSESVPAGTEQCHLATNLNTEEYGLTFRLLFTPLWWAFTSASAYRAFRKLLIPSQRHTWDKTTHGHALEHEAQLAQLTTGTTPSSADVLRHPQGDIENA